MDTQTTLILIFVVGSVFSIYRSAVRRRSLHQAKDGRRYWTEWHGRAGSSPRDPRKPGGAWYGSGGEGSGMSDDGGGDGGGD